MRLHVHKILIFYNFTYSPLNNFCPDVDCCHEDIVSFLAAPFFAQGQSCFGRKKPVF